MKLHHLFIALCLSCAFFACNDDDDIQVPTNVVPTQTGEFVDERDQNTYLHKLLPCTPYSYTGRKYYTYLHRYVQVLAYDLGIYLRKRFPYIPYPYTYCK